MAIKKYTSGAWVPTTYRKYGTETDTITSLPAQIIGDGQVITSCQISGNTVQNGTPTPEAPVDVVGCGERTENLAPIISEDSGWRVGYLTNQGTYTNNNPRGEILSPMISLSGIGSFIISASNYFSPSMSTYYFNGATFISTQSAADYGGSVFDNFPSGATCFCFAIRTGYQTIDSVVNHGWRVMLNAGSTALPYEPYGFKLPLTVNGTEYPIYLGQVPTTRRIRKLVFDGTEDWVYRAPEPSSTFFLEIAGAIFINNHGLCTHYLNQDSGGFSELADKHVLIRLSMDETKSYIGLRDSSITSIQVEGVTELKEYLAAQYAAGTPVTVWYVLADPETGIVNEPLHKIGGYADTVTATNVPTTGTPENFDVGTTLKPSEVQLTYHGWHEHTDTKYTE